MPDMGITKSKAYNEALERKALDGDPAEPECEECGDDLADRHAYRVEGAWVCADCRAELLEVDDDEEDEEEDAEEEDDDAEEDTDDGSDDDGGHEGTYDGELYVPPGNW